MRAHRVGRLLLGGPGGGGQGRSRRRDHRGAAEHPRRPGRLFGEAVAAASAHTPREPHWYLALIGADPAAQGQGHGAALLRSGLAKADAAGLPAYLESSKPSNLPLYEHFGFRVRAEVPLPGGGPVLWGMWREPRRPA